MMALVVGSYYLLYVPSLIESFISYNPAVEYYISACSVFVFYMNALINPFIYSWNSKEFNTAYRKMLRINKRVNTNTTVVTVTDHSGSRSAAGR